MPQNTGIRRLCTKCVQNSGKLCIFSSKKPKPKHNIENEDDRMIKNLNQMSKQKNKVEIFSPIQNKKACYSFRKK